MHDYLIAPSPYRLKANYKQMLVKADRFVARLKASGWQVRVVIHPEFANHPSGRAVRAQVVAPHHAANASVAADTVVDAIALAYGTLMLSFVPPPRDL